MATALDERPAPRQPILYGRALVAQQEADRRAQADAAREERNARLDQEKLRMDEIRTKQMEIQTAQRDDALNLTREQLNLQIAKHNAGVVAANEKIRMETQQTKQFTSAMVAVGRLNPKSPTYINDVARIKAAHPVVFGSAGNDYNEALNEVLKQQESERNTYLTNAAKIYDTNDKLRIAHEAGLDIEQVTADGIVAKKPEAGFETFSPNEKLTGFDIARQKYPNAHLTGTTAPDGTFTLKSQSTGAADRAEPGDATTVTPKRPLDAILGGAPDKVSNKTVSDLVK